MRPDRVGLTPALFLIWNFLWPIGSLGLYHLHSCSRQHTLDLSPLPPIILTSKKAFWRAPHSNLAHAPSASTQNPLHPNPGLLLASVSRKRDENRAAELPVTGIKALGEARCQGKGAVSAERDKGHCEWILELPPQEKRKKKRETSRLAQGMSEVTHPGF